MGDAPETETVPIHYTGDPTGLGQAVVGLSTRDTSWVTPEVAAGAIDTGLYAEGEAPAAGPDADDAAGDPEPFDGPAVIPQPDPPLRDGQTFSVGPAIDTEDPDAGDPATDDPARPEGDNA